MVYGGDLPTIQGINRGTITRTTAGSRFNESRDFYSALLQSTVGADKAPPLRFAVIFALCNRGRPEDGGRSAHIDHAACLPGECMTRGILSDVNEMYGWVDDETLVRTRFERAIKDSQHSQRRNRP